MKKLPLKTECTFSILIMMLLILLTVLELLNSAANAAFARSAAAARLVTASQQLQQCREDNNPWLTSPFGPPRAAMWAPDPCWDQEKELAEATIANQEAISQMQRSGQPTQADLGSAPAPQLTDTLDIANQDPAIPITELVVPSPDSQNTWSPDTVLEILDLIADEMEVESPGSTQREDVMEVLETLYINIVVFLSWDSWGHPRKGTKIVYKPNNQDWINKWMPN
ncbi:nonstructural protein 2 [Galliform chaphamaparvovirus 6]|nr:nonstructural protein 2 [Galliform chaphamaparvovirus 6]